MQGRVRESPSWLRIEKLARLPCSGSQSRNDPSFCSLPQTRSLIGNMTATLVVQRLAGVSGALAVAAGAYGAHGFRRSDRDDYLKEAGGLLTAGMGLFCGALYHQAITGDPSLSKLAPYGGTMLIAGWAAIAL
ncbi:transmembrane protein 256 isoform X2 [Anguilla rostrata]|uniref:transmembrane protein 256 isoform X2 n=1 Tax=Anguilla rostrata TaxID=7938 RepID=UPI0030D30E4D